MLLTRRTLRLPLLSLLSILTIISCTLGKSLTASADTNSQLVELPVSTHHQSELEEMIERLRAQAPRKTVYNSIPHLNKTIEEKRQMLRQYREKLRELNLLDEKRNYDQSIHKKDFHSYEPSDDGKRDGFYYFPVNIAQPSDHKLEATVEKASIKLYRDSSLSQVHRNHDSPSELLTKGNVGHNTVLLVYQTLPGGMRRLVTSKVISLLRSEWIRIDITEIVQSWLDEPGMNHGIEIECTNQNISQIISRSPEGSNQPSLDILTYEKPINVRRIRREATEGQCANDRCCRKPVEIKYSDVNLFVDGIHEEGETFTAYVCNGRCPRGHLLHNYWSRMKDTLRSRYHNSTHYRTRCVPVAYDTFQYLHIDESGEYDVRINNDIIVKECACV